MMTDIPDEPKVWLNFLDGTQKPLDEVVHQMIEKSAQTGLPVGFSGHTILCELEEVEIGTDCNSCKHACWESDKCEIGQPQTADYDSSVVYNQTGNRCQKYVRIEGIECTCDEESIDDDFE